MPKRIIKPVHKVMDRLGRRGTVLAIFSLIYLFISLKALIDPSNHHGYFLTYEMLPHWLRFIVWFVPAALGFVAAMQKARRTDAFGFSALAVPAAVMIVSYFTSWVGYLIGLTTYGTGWINGLEWLLILLLLMVTSGWTEVKRHVVSVPLIDEGEDA